MKWAKKFIIGLLCIFSLEIYAFGEKNEWSEGWGQGVSEYQATIVPNVTYLYIACDPYKPVQMWFYHKQKSYGSDSRHNFDMLIDGVKVERPYETYSHAQASQLWYFLERAPKAKAIYIVTDDKKKFKLPRKGIATNFPTSGLKKTEISPCRSELEL